MVELVQVVLARKDGSVRQHLSQDATHRPYINGFGVALVAGGGRREISQDLGLLWLSHLLFWPCMMIPQLGRCRFLRVVAIWWNEN